MKHLFFVVSLMALISCGENLSKTRGEIDKTALLAKGDSIAMIAQKTLVGKLTSAISERGVPGAVAFCNLNAMPLTDSLSMSNNVGIQRLSDKNRNPANTLSSIHDKEAWTKIQKMMADTGIKDKHLLMEDKNSVYYYKAIPLGMPLCLNCHGQKDKDIAPDVFKIISEKYPQDKAIGYEAGQLRGMRKIKMTVNE